MPNIKNKVKKKLVEILNQSISINKIIPVMLHNVDLSFARFTQDLNAWDFTRGCFRSSVFDNTHLSNISFRHCDLSFAKFKRCVIYDVDFTNAQLNNARFIDCDLEHSSLKGANLSEVRGLTSQSQFIKENFSFDKKGNLIAYKSFNEHYFPPISWVIQEKSFIEENVSFDRTETCACGVNIATLEWCLMNCTQPLWKVKVLKEDLSGISVPYNSDGKIRAERVLLVRKLKEKESK